MSIKISDYYDVVSTNDNLLHFRLKNFWSSKFIKEHGAAFLAQFKATIDSYGRKRFIVFADMSEFKTPGPEAKALIAAAMKYGLEHGLYKAVELMPMAMQRMGVEQAAKQIDQTGFRVVVKESSEAMEQIEALRREISQMV